MIYLGPRKQASLLNGGFEAWLADGRPITIEALEIKRGTITPHPRPELVVDSA